VIDGSNRPNPADRLVLHFGRSAPASVSAWLAAAPAGAAVVFVEASDDSPKASKSAKRVGNDMVLARLSPVTDAIKRVEGDLVVDTVDRAQLRSVGPPVVVSLDLFRRWWSARTGDSPEGRVSEQPVDVAGLLSELVSIEPDLRVVDLGPVLQPGASHG
jgi:hypothetical protein